MRRTYNQLVAEVEAKGKGATYFQKLHSLKGTQLVRDLMASMRNMRKPKK
jgi:hypothetical protein